MLTLAPYCARPRDHKTSDTRGSCLVNTPKTISSCPTRLCDSWFLSTYTPTLRVLFRNPKPLGLTTPSANPRDPVGHVTPALLPLSQRDMWLLSVTRAVVSFHHNLWSYNCCPRVPLRSVACGPAHLPEHATAGVRAGPRCQVVPGEWPRPCLWAKAKAQCEEKDPRG